MFGAGCDEGRGPLGGCGMVVGMGAEVERTMGVAVGLGLGPWEEQGEAEREGSECCESEEKKEEGASWSSANLSEGSCCCWDTERRRLL